MGYILRTENTLQTRHVSLSYSICAKKREKCEDENDGGKSDLACIIPDTKEGERGGEMDMPTRVMGRRPVKDGKRRPRLHVAISPPLSEKKERTECKNI